MNRRSFLKMLSVSPLGVFIPATIKGTCHADEKAFTEDEGLLVHDSMEAFNKEIEQALAKHKGKQFEILPADNLSRLAKGVVIFYEENGKEIAYGSWVKLSAVREYWKKNYNSDYHVGLTSETFLNDVRWTMMKTGQLAS